jgi:hypothetical protein
VETDRDREREREGEREGEREREGAIYICGYLIKDKEGERREESSFPDNILFSIYLPHPPTHL